MDRKLKTWELALMFGLLCAIAFGGWLDREQNELSRSIIRLHIIANSDSPEDQALKLIVRDRVLEQAQALYPSDATREQALEILADNLPALQQAAQAAVDEQGADQAVSARVERCWFPTREYKSFALPAGEYTALRVVLGEGEGQNWWCVAFPPLCLGAASETVSDAAALGQLTGAQAALITRADQGYILKFKALELWDQLHTTR